MKNNLNISLITEMLEQEIKEYNRIIAERETQKANIDLLNQMINLLNSGDYEAMRENSIMFYTIIPLFFPGANESVEKAIDSLFSSIYTCLNYTKNPEKYYEKDIILCTNNIKKFSSKLKKLIEQQTAKLLLTSTQTTEEDIEEYKRIISNVQYKRKILSRQYELLLKLFKRKNIPDKEIIILLEIIKGYNITTHIRSSKINPNKLEEIINIQFLGFEKFENINWLESDRKSQLDSLIESIISQGVDDIIIQMFPTYKGNLTFSDGYEINHIKYFYIKLLNYYQNQLLEVKNQFNYLDNYLDKSSRDIIVEMFNEFKDYYLLVRKKMDQELEKYNKDFEKLKQEEDVNKLQFAAKENSTTFFESDLKDLEKDTYKSLVELLIKFKKNRVQTKQLKAPNNGYSEIKDDQLRIIYKHLEKNKYLILGVFSKKEDNKIFEYNKICSRKPDIILDGDTIEKELFDRMVESSHFGGRRNTK